MQLPKEVSILKALIEMERAAALKPPVPESTFPADLASITGQTLRLLRVTLVFNGAQEREIPGKAVHKGDKKGPMLIASAKVTVAARRLCRHFERTNHKFKPGQ